MPRPNLDCCPCEDGFFGLLRIVFKKQDMVALRSEAFVGGWESDHHIKHEKQL